MRIASITILFVVCCFSLSQTQAQSTNKHAIDSLEALLKNPTNDSAWVDVLNELALAYYNSDIKKALLLGQDAMKLSETLRYPRGIVTAQRVLRRIYRRVGNYSAAIELTLTNLALTEKLRDSTELLEAYTDLGNIYTAMENFSEAQVYLFKAYRLSTHMQSYKHADLMNFIGRVYGKMGLHDSAVYFIQSAIAHEAKFPQPGYGLSYMYNNLAEVYIALRQYDNATRYYGMSLALPENKKTRFGMTFTLNGLARVYQKTKQYDKAIASALQSIEIAKKDLLRDKVKEAYLILYEVYKEQKQYAEALEYFREYNMYKDSILSEDKIQFIENLKVNYETKSISQENELLRKETELKNVKLQQQLIIAWSAVGATVLLCVLSVLLYRINVQRKKSNKFLRKYNRKLEREVKARTAELESTNQELVKQNHQLEQFGYVTAHNLRAPVARIMGLINIVGDTNNFMLPRDAPVMDKLKYATYELDTIVHDLSSLVQVRSAPPVELQVMELQDIWRKVNHILSDSVKEADFEITADFSKAPQCKGLAVYLESVFYHLISNSIKYRSPERRGSLCMKSVLEKGQVVISFLDNGIGFNLDKVKAKLFQPFQRFHHHVNGRGLGLYLIKTQVEAMKGSVDVVSRENEGSQFTIRLPLA